MLVTLESLANEANNLLPSKNGKLEFGPKTPNIELLEEYLSPQDMVSQKH
jgi:hypothetical protein